MKATELRQSILQAAVQGRLVPQDPNDEPASELLKRIQQEKARFVKEGKIKKEKPLPPITKDEIPYTLPKGWVWCRLGNLGNVQSSKRVFTSEFVDNGIPFYRGTEVGVLSVGKMIVPRYHIDKERYYDLIQHTGKLVVGDLLLPSICHDGRIWLVDTEEPFYFKDGCVLWVRLIRNYINNRYVQQALKARLISDYTNIASGTIFAELKIFLLREIVIPLPPLSEQGRIISKLDELMALCDKLEIEEKKLEGLEVRFTDYLPKAILQSAVQGKLVPQDPHDEPASELLKRIRQEKVRLIKEGKLKKERPLPSITKDEIPYDLPEGWEWCRLRDIGQIVSGATPDSHNNNYYTDAGQGISWLTPADMMKYTRNNYIQHGTKDITQAGYDSCSTMLMPAESVIFSSRAPIGHIAFSAKELCTNQGFKSVAPYITDLAHWIFYVLKSKVDDIESRASGTTFKEVSGKFMEAEIIPLPPLAEQKRIVAKADRLVAFCYELKEIYTTPIKHSTTKDILLFPAIKTEEETLLAARGNAGQLSNEAMRAIDDLFAEDEE